MRLALAAAPDDRAVRAAAYGPIVLAGAYGTDKPADDAPAGGRGRRRRPGR